MLPPMNSPSSSPVNLPEIHIVQVDPPSSWRPLVVPATVVIVGLVIAGFLFAHYGRSKPDASGQVMQQGIYSVQVDPGSQPVEPGMAGAVEEQDETVLLVQARVTNVSNHPLTLFDMTASVDSPQGTRQSSDALPEDIDRLFQRFPDLAAWHTQSLSRHQVIAPGQSAEGLLVFNYPWTKQQWEQHKQARVTISFENGRSLVLPLQ